MQLKNTPEEFGLVAKSFHWAVAILVFLALSAGFFMVGLPSSPFKITVYLTHKSIGITILLLMIGRLAWRLTSPRPEPLLSYKKWEETLSKIVHFCLYCCLFLMPLSGWIMSSAGGFPATFFGLFSLPAIVEKNQQLFAITRTIHEFTAYGILILLALHVAGAFKHHFIDKDVTLQRMTSRKVGLKLGILLAVVAGVLWIKPVTLILWPVDGNKLAAIASTPAAQTQPSAEGGWIIDLQNSTIGFEATQSGERFTGKFKNFGGKIIFDPAKLDDAYVDIWIDIGSIDTGSSDRDSQARSSDWFDTAQFPRAQFVADSFTQAGPGRYVAHGALTVRSQAAVVDLPFKLEIRESPQGQAALMEGSILLNRLDFGVGQGQWQATDTIGNEVKINITVLADSP